MRPRLSRHLRSRGLLCFLALSYSTCTAFQGMHRTSWSDCPRPGCSSHHVLTPKYQVLSPSNAAVRHWESRRVNDDSDAGTFVPAALSLKQLIRELEARRIRFAPTASRLDLQQLLEKSTSSGDRHLHEAEESSCETTQEGRENLLSKGLHNGNSTTHQESTSVLTTPSAENDPVSDYLAERDRSLFLFASDFKSLPLAELLMALNDRGIRYPPTAQRPELVLLLSAALGLSQTTLVQERHATVSNSPLGSKLQVVQEDLGPQKSDSTHQRRDEARRRRRRGELRAGHQNQKMAPWERFVDSTHRRIQSLPRVAGETYEKASRQVRRLHRKANDYILVDDDGVRDVDFTYLYRDENLYGRVNRWSDDKFNDARVELPRSELRMEGQQSSATSRPAYRASSVPKSSRRSSIPGPKSLRFRTVTASTEWKTTRRHRRSTGTHDRRQMRNDSSVSTMQRTRLGVITRRPLLLPPAKGKQMPVELDASMKLNTPSSPADGGRASAKRPPKKRLYSPYGDHDEIADGFDRFSSFVADVAERFMWGPDDDADRWSRKGPDDEKSRMPPDATTNVDGYRHWKDRLEAQFDTFLGIREDGSYYQRWAEKALNDKRNEGGRDPFSVARGVQPKRRGLASRTRRCEKPIWEEEGNLIALLFGRTQSGNSLLFEKLLDPTHGSLLYLFRAVFRSFMLVSSYACRWASVRGAFPQPVVVVGVFSAALCAPRRQRLVAVIAALALFRALGELAHGYAYGNGGWDDDADDD